LYDEERTPTRPVVQMPGGVSASNIHPHFAVADLIKAADELTTGEALSVVATVTASAEIIATAPEPGADLLTQWAE
jgi:hypothetical protein